jgi:hypothetical protein
VSAIKSPRPEGIKRVNINIPIPLHNAFKAATAAKGVNMTDVLMDYIRDYVAKNNMKGRRR